MGQPKSIAAYSQEIDLWQRALESPRGIKIACTDPTSAWRKRQRLFAARQRAREYNASAFPADDPRSRSSFYEGISIIQQGSDLLMVHAQPIIQLIEDL